jgi:hypothetical protein
MTKLLNLLVEIVKFGFEVLLLLFENLCMLLLSLTGGEPVTRVRKLQQGETEEYLRCFSVPEKTFLRLELLHLILVSATLDQVINVVQRDLGRDRYLRVLLAYPITSIAFEKRLMTRLDRLDIC